MNIIQLESYKKTPPDSLTLDEIELIKRFRHQNLMVAHEHGNDDSLIQSIEKAYNFIAKHRESTLPVSKNTLSKKLKRQEKSGHHPGTFE